MRRKENKYIENNRHLREENGFSFNNTNRMFHIRTVFRRYEFFDDCVMWIVL